MLTFDQVESLCGAATMAPSIDNRQPWQVTVLDSRMEIGLAPGLPDRLLDLDDRASLFALGAFAENVRIVAPGLGLQAGTPRIDPSARHAVVTFHFSPRSRARPHRLAPAFSDPEGEPATQEILSDETLEGLRSTVESTRGLTLSAVESPRAKREVGRALVEAEQLRLRNPRLLADLIDDVRWTAEEALAAKDGIDLRLLPAAAAWRLRLIREWTPWVRLLGKRVLAELVSRPLQESSHACCLAMGSRPTDRAMVLAGMAMQRLWLMAKADRVRVDPLWTSTLLLMRSETQDGVGFTDEENLRIHTMGRHLRAAFELPASTTPILVFRLSTGQIITSPAPRHSWRTFTTIWKGTTEIAS